MFINARAHEFAARLRAEIHKGTYTPGGRLPSAVDLARSYDTPIHTVRCALHLLRADNTIISHRYIGHFVTTGNDAPMDPRRLRTQIADDLRHKITNEDYEPGQRLPSMRELATHYHTSTMPVRQALELLAHEKLLTMVRGVGTYVALPEDTQTHPADQVPCQLHQA